MNNEEIIENIQLLSMGKPIIVSDNEADEIYSLLLNHKCYYILYRAKSTNKNVLKAKALIAKNKAIVSERYRLCENIFNKLNDNGIKYAIYKGAVLSYHAFGDFYYRTSADIDIITKKENIANIKKILYEDGFIQGRIKNGEITTYTRQELIFHTSMTHQAASFIKKNDSDILPYLNIDVNFDLMWGEADKNIDIDVVLEENDTMNIQGVNVSILPLIIDFIAVCLHHYKDMNSIYQIHNGKLKLYLLLDIYYYLKNHKNDISPKELLYICEKLNVTEYIYYCIYHAIIIFGDSVLYEYAEILKTANGEYLIDKFGLDNKEIKVWNCNFFDRIFDNNFGYCFLTSLTEEDVKKIKFNADMML